MFTIKARINKDNLWHHGMVTGGSGSGKSQLLLNIAISLITSSNRKRDCSVILQEPHADLAKKLVALRALDDDRIVYISTTIQKESGYPDKICAGFNPFLTPPDADDDFRNLLATQLANTIAELIENSPYGLTLQMEMLLRPAILVVLSLPAEQRNMNTLKKFFDDKNNENLLQYGKSHFHPQIRDFFLNHWGAKEYDISKRSIISKLNYFLNDVNLYDILHNDGVSIEECMDAGKVIIINAPRGANPFTASVIGRLMLSYVFCLAMRREAKQMHQRKQVYYLIDEANSYVSSALANSLLELRKYKVALLISLQSIKTLDPKIKSALTTNTFLKCVSVCDGESRSFYSRELSVSAEELSQLKPLMFYVKRSNDTPAFRVRVPIVSDHLFLGKEAMQKRYTHIIEKSGVYKKLPPPLPPAPPSPETHVSENKPYKKTEQKKNKTDNPFAGQKPAF